MWKSSSLFNSGCTNQSEAQARREDCMQIWYKATINLDALRCRCGHNKYIDTWYNVRTIFLGLGNHLILHRIHVHVCNYRTRKMLSQPNQCLIQFLIVELCQFIERGSAPSGVHLRRFYRQAFQDVCKATKWTRIVDPEWPPSLIIYSLEYHTRTNFCQISLVSNLKLKTAGLHKKVCHCWNITPMLVLNRKPLLVYI